VGIALGSASQIALFVAPVLVLLSYVIGPAPMDLRFWPGAVVMMLIATLTAWLVTNSGRSAWFVGVLVLMVYLIFALTLDEPTYDFDRELPVWLFPRNLADKAITIRFDSAERWGADFRTLYKNGRWC
jgi:hypothetical protein